MTIVTIPARVLRVIILAIGAGAWFALGWMLGVALFWAADSAFHISSSQAPFAWVRPLTRCGAVGGFVGVVVWWFLQMHHCRMVDRLGRP